MAKSSLAAAAQRMPSSAKLDVVGTVTRVRPAGTYGRQPPAVMKCGTSQLASATISRTGGQPRNEVSWAVVCASRWAVPTLPTREFDGNAGYETRSTKINDGENGSPR